MSTKIILDSYIIDGLPSGRRVCLKANICVPEHGHNLHQHDLVVERDEVEIEKLNCWPDFVVRENNVRKFAFEFLPDIVGFVSLQKSD